MKKLFCLLLVLALVLAGCRKPAAAVVPTEQILPTISAEEATTAPPQTTQPEETEEQQTEETESAPTEPEITEPAHSDLYLEGVSVEDVIVWFNEVVLDGEFVNSGDPSRLQKWQDPICYSIEGEPTAEDIAVLESFGAWLNTVEGFPGIHQAEAGEYVNLRFYFTDSRGFLTIMGPNAEGLDGMFTFWYDGMDRIYEGVTCIRKDIDQSLRNSVILEELYNGLGPAQDTRLRPDSIVYQEFAQPQELTAVDQLLLQLLYHPDMECGMNGAQCEAVIRNLYY